ncbi:MAG: Ig-like domain-containing protein, partial [Rubrivivax sp.]
MTPRGLPLSLLAITLWASTASGSESLAIHPPALQLRGPESVQQVAVSTNFGRDASSPGYSISDPKVATVDAAGLVSPTGDGSTVLTVQSGDSIATALVTVRDFASPPPVHFANHVVPIFTKLGCNSGGCHGKASGQNGFRLSL